MFGGNLTNALRSYSGENRLDGADIEKARRFGEYRACENNLTLAVEDLEIGEFARSKSRLRPAQGELAQLWQSLL